MSNTESTESTKSSTSDREEESFEDWILCGADGETFVGKKTGAGEAEGRYRLFPCYKYNVHVLQVPQMGRDRAGHVVQTGINIVQQEAISAPTGTTFDLEVVIKPTWIVLGEGEHRKQFLAHVKRLVTMARQMQLQARAAAAGVQTASRLST